MKNSKPTYITSGFLLLVIIFLVSSCKKYLDKKPDKRLAVINSVTDLQSLMDNQGIHYLSELSSDEISADNYYLTDERWSSMSNEKLRRMYNWQPDFLFVSGNGNEWGKAYNSIYYANTAIENSQIARLLNLSFPPPIPMRGVRWFDLKRLNKEVENITLYRMVNNQTYILPPNDLR
jgi:hypothetical protein